MKIPSKLKIGGHIVKVIVCDLEDNGESDFETNTIKISRLLPASQKESTLVHEIFHFLNTTIDDAAYGHALVDSLSEQFYQVLKDNRLLR